MDSIQNNTARMNDKQLGKKLRIWLGWERGTGFFKIDYFAFTKWLVLKRNIYEFGTTTTFQRINRQ